MHVPRNGSFVTYHGAAKTNIDHIVWTPLATIYVKTYTYNNLFDRQCRSRPLLTHPHHMTVDHQAVLVLINNLSSSHRRHTHSSGLVTIGT